MPTLSYPTTRRMPGVLIRCACVARRIASVAQVGLEVPERLRRVAS